MVKMIIDVSMYIFEAVLFFFYCQTAFTNKYDKKINMTLIIVAYGILLGIYQFGNAYVNAACNTVFCILIIYFLYDVSILESFIHSFLFYVFLIASEYITIPIISILFKNGFDDFKDNDYSYILVVFISKLCHLICCILVLQVYRYIKHKDTLKGFSLMLFIPVSNIVVLELIFSATIELHYKPKMYYVWAISGILMMVSSFLVFFNRNYIISQSNKINELTIENQKKELDEQYFSVLEKSNDDMQILAHDFKNHLSYVRHLDNAEEKDKYIDKIYPEIEKFQQTASTGNKTLDVILSKYTSICALNAIVFKADVKNANLSQMESVDLIALLNNLLDNAVEAAEQSAAKRITLTLVKDTQFIDKLVIANSCDTAPAQSGDKLLTRKKEGALHGTGLKSVKKVCEQCGANYAWEYDSEKQLFTTTVLMPKEQNGN